MLNNRRVRSNRTGIRRTRSNRPNSARDPSRKKLRKKSPGSNVEGNSRIRKTSASGDPYMTHTKKSRTATPKRSRTSRSPEKTEIIRLIDGLRTEQAKGKRQKEKETQPEKGTEEPKNSLQVENMLGDLRLHLATTRRRLDDLSSKFKTQLTSHQIQTKALKEERAEVSRLRSRVWELENQDDENQDLKYKITDLKATLEAQRAKCRQLAEAQRLGVREETEKVQGLQSTHVQQLAELRKQRDEAVEEVANVKHKLKKQDEKLEQMKTVVARAQEQLKEKEKHSAALLKQYESSEQKLRMLDESLSGVKVEEVRAAIEFLSNAGCTPNGTKDRKVLSADADNVQLKLEIKKLVKDNGDLSRSLNMAMIELNQLKSEARSVAELLRRQKEEISERDDEISNMKIETANLRMTVEDLKKKALYGYPTQGDASESIAAVDLTIFSGRKAQSILKRIEDPTTRMNLIVLKVISATLDKESFNDGPSMTQLLIDFIEFDSRKEEWNLVHDISEWQQGFYPQYNVVREYEIRVDEDFVEYLDSADDNAEDNLRVEIMRQTYNTKNGKTTDDQFSIQSLGAVSISFAEFSKGRARIAMTSPIISSTDGTSKGELKWEAYILRHLIPDSGSVTQEVPNDESEHKKDGVESESTQETEEGSDNNNNNLSESKIKI